MQSSNFSCEKSKLDSELGIINFFHCSKNSLGTRRNKKNLTISDNYDYIYCSHSLAIYKLILSLQFVYKFKTRKSNCNNGRKDIKRENWKWQSYGWQQKKSKIKLELAMKAFLHDCIACGIGFRFSRYWTLIYYVDYTHKSR